MIIRPKVKGFICTTAHPNGCRANVEQLIRLARQGEPGGDRPRNVLVIGASTGYGLASRVTAAFGYGAKTLGVFLERPATGGRTATAGWYNSAAFHEAAARAGLYARSINADAFANATKDAAIAEIRANLAPIDLVVYSLASPRRLHPDSGKVYSSVLKPIGAPLQQTGLDTDRGVIRQFNIEPATAEEIENTVAVMGGDDWQRWMDALRQADVLAPNCKTTAYTYIGDSVTRDIYWNGTIGAAKKDLDRVAGVLRQSGLDARVSVLKAVVTQASAAIPAMPLYLALLFRIMKQAGSNEGCGEQIQRLFRECLYGRSPREDDAGRYRVDDRELAPEVQAEVARLWLQVTNENLNQISDFQGFRTEFMRLFGFDVNGVDYEAEVDPEVPIDGLVEPRS